MDSLLKQQRRDTSQQQQQLPAEMLTGATEQFVKESSGKERDGEEEEEDEDDHDDDDNYDGDDDVIDDTSLPQQPGVETQRWLTVSYAGLPEWLRDNELIETGHRPQLNNFFTCLASVFRVHSETGNIWTHLIGMMTVGVLAVEHLLRPPSELAWQDKACFIVFHASMMSCFGYSFISHTFCCHSPLVLRYLCIFDYVGIVLAITGSLMPWLYYGYHCHRGMQATHVALSLALCVVCLVYIATTFDEFIHRRGIGKAGVFLALGLSCIVPAAHLALIIGYHDSFPYLALFGASYILGAIVYATRVPESIWPGYFDTWLSSHQWFHLLHVVAMLLEYHALSLVAEDRLRFADCRHVER